MTFRVKQIGLAICLIASLLIVSVSACSCAHNQDTAKSSGDSCHSSHQQLVNGEERSVASTSIDVDCICFVSVPSPLIAAKSDVKKFGASDGVPVSDEVVFDPLLLTSSTSRSSKPEYARNFSYSTDYQSFKPSRAPPRL